MIRSCDGGKENFIVEVWLLVEVGAFYMQLIISIVVLILYAKRNKDSDLGYDGYQKPLLKGNLSGYRKEISLSGSAGRRPFGSRY